ncbi:MAG: hypothetical protein L6R40_007053 [Gallowayella cf. fulva]|nr:MAG: hypothetical protein L6R40_007053 [Xanthomendoza cf. fulva]
MSLSTYPDLWAAQTRVLDRSSTKDMEVKMEPNGLVVNGHEGHIKVEPPSAAASPAAHSDDDLYEDAGDLDFSRTAQGLYLTRIPKYLWESWSTLDDEEEIQIGTVRVEGGLEDVKRMSLILSPQVDAQKNIPKEYNMHLASRKSTNTFVFSEKDLHGRTIPKQTALLGQIQTEVNCLPVENTNYKRIMDARAKAALAKPRRETKMVERQPQGRVYAPTGLRQANAFESGFTKLAKPMPGKGQHLKAARLPRNELKDLIFGCFKRFKYWAVRTMKKELDQPETYLKEVLEEVAVMARSGFYANHWQLRPEYEDPSNDNVKSEVAPAVEGAGDSEDEDENVKMEDVI